MRINVLSADAERELVATLRSIRELADRLRMLEPLVLTKMIGAGGGGGDGIAAILGRILNPPPSSQPPTP